MPNHKFRIGQHVNLLPPISRHASGGVYVVTKQLPQNAGEYEYGIRRVRVWDQEHQRSARTRRTGKRVGKIIVAAAHTSSTPAEPPAVCTGSLNGID